MSAFVKYPRTYHLQGSKGEVSADHVPWSALSDQFIVIEEKYDGTQLGFCFDDQGQLQCQSRGTIIEHTPPQDNMSLFKNWAYTHYIELWRVLGARYLVFGEWLYAKHTVFYDQLPGYFLEFDVYDRAQGCFLSTQARRALLIDLPLNAVPVLWQGPARDLREPEGLIQRSVFKSERWRERLEEVSGSMGLPWADVRQQTEMQDEGEGLYIKVETAQETIGRYKYIRPGFIHTILSNDQHWRARRVIANQLATSNAAY